MSLMSITINNQTHDVNPCDFNVDYKFSYKLGQLGYIFKSISMDDYNTYQDALKIETFSKRKIVVLNDLTLASFFLGMGAYTTFLILTILSPFFSLGATGAIFISVGIIISLQMMLEKNDNTAKLQAMFPAAREALEKDVIENMKLFNNSATILRDIHSRMEPLKEHISKREEGSDVSYYKASLAYYEEVGQEFERYINLYRQKYPLLAGL